MSSRRDVPRPLGRTTRRSFLKGVVTVGAGLTAAGAAASACGSSVAGQGTRVRIWSWLTGMNKYVDAFNNSQSDIHVELSVIAAGVSGGYAQQANAIRAHNAPDILHTEYQGLPQILLTGGLRDLSSDMADLAGGYSAAAWTGVRPGGRTWAVPFDLAPMAFYYRKDLFDANGLTVPTTWGAFRDAAAAVRGIDPGAHVTTFPLSDGAFYAGMSWGADDPWWRIDGDSWRVSVDNPGSQKVAQYWQSMIDDDLVATTATGTQDWISGLHTGKLWGLLGAAWSLGSLKKFIPEDKNRWAVAPLPTWEGSPPTNGMHGGTAFGVSRESKNPEAALTFLRWLSTDPAVPKIAAGFTSLFPAYTPNRQGARAEFTNDYFIGEPVYDVLDLAATRVPEWTWGPNSLGMFSTIQDNIGGAATGGPSLSAALKPIHTAAVADLRDRGISVIERTTS